MTTTTRTTRPAAKPLVVSETERSRITYTRRVGYELTFDGVDAGTFDTMEAAETERDRRLNAQLERCPALSGTTTGEPQIDHALQYDATVRFDGGPWQTLDRHGWTYTEAEQIGEAVQG